jgi:CRISPR-associated protein Csm3
VIRDPLTGRPYIPGSSFKGKMRSLLERSHGLPQNWPIARVFIHACKTEAEYGDCAICPPFGIPAPNKDPWFCLTRLRFSDIMLSDTSAAAMDDASLHLPFTEIKTEVAIDRTTSAATPRNIERVPAGAVFAPARIGLFRYEDDPDTYLETLVNGLELLEADYLGGSGARGSGRIRLGSFQASRIAIGSGGSQHRSALDDTIESVEDLRRALPKIHEWMRA